MTSYQRFNDDNYKNWLKTAESLSILRSGLHNLLENETETLHTDLKKILDGENCESKCEFKKSSKQVHLCSKCERWKTTILSRHVASKYMVHWENCAPHLWPREKWEVAKVFMPRGQKDHRSFNQFDISAILNFMVNCKHFKNIINKTDLLTKVIHVRNKVMHSPDLKLQKEVMDEGIKNVLHLAKILEPKAQELKTIEEDIEKFSSVLEQYPGQVAQSAVDAKDAGNIKLLEREQQALKDRIEFLAQCSREDQHGEIKEELHGIKNFLDQNKDLLEKLGPQVACLSEMQEKVEQHDQRIEELDDRVDQLEKGTQDPMFSDDPLKFKNHLIEEARQRNWSAPVFTEDREASGYRGRVEVNGMHFTGTHVLNSRKRAHQEVAKIALEKLKSLRVSEEETSTSANDPPPTSTTSSSASLFYGSVTVDLSQEVTSERCLKQEEATESAYKKLASRFGLNSSKDGTFKPAVLDHFTRFRLKLPTESPDSQDDKFICKLQLSEGITFSDKEGATKKKQAEQQAAKVAVQQLAGFLNCSVAVGEENYKGFLKERLDALNMQNPSYSWTVGKTERREEPETPSTGGVHSQIPSTETIGQANSSDAGIKMSDTRTPDNATTKSTKRQDLSPPSPPIKRARTDDAEINNILQMYYLKSSVTVKNIQTIQNFSCDVQILLEDFTFENNDPYNSKKDAARQTYHSLGKLLGIFKTDTDESIQATKKVKEHFSQKSRPLPVEDFKSDNASFCCSIANINYTIVYTGEGPTVATAKQEALNKALTVIPSLFGYKALPKSDSVEENEAQINNLLTNKDQKALTCTVKEPLYKMATDLLFKAYTFKAKRQGTKKETRNNICKSILGLLGVTIGSNPLSYRNCLDEWFKEKHLEPPVFEDSEDDQGSKATFTVMLSCTHPDWEKSVGEAKQKLIQELHNRFQNLT